jgi:hypothetical protein
MTVASNDLLVGPVTPTNGTTLISIDFYFENASDLEVYKSGSNTPLTITTDYTVSLPSGVNETDGSITLVTPADGTDRYSIYLKQPLARSSDLQFRSDQRSPVLNLEFDRLWRAIQGINTALDRVFRFSQTSDVPGPLDAETAAVRAGKLIGFSADGQDIIRVSIADASVVVVTAATDNAVLRYDAAGETLAESGVTIDDNAKVTINSQSTTDLEIVSAVPTMLFEDTSSGSKALIGSDDNGSLYLTADQNEDAPGNPFLYFTVAGTSAMSIDASGHMRVGDATPPTVTAEFAGTDAILLPVGTTAQRPGNVAGRFRYNSTTGTVEFNNGSSWSAVGATFVVSTETADWSGTESLDPANGLVQVITLTGDVTTLTDDMEDGEFVTMLIDDGTDYEITWPTATWLSDGGNEVVLQTSGVTRVDALKVGSTLYLTAINGV